MGGLLAMPLADTLKRAEETLRVAETDPARRTCGARRRRRCSATSCCARGLERKPDATDESQAVESCWATRPRLVQGENTNIKVTFAEDLDAGRDDPVAPGHGRRLKPMRIGQGFDVHQLVAGRKLVIGGVEIAHDKGLLGHSDADVLLHAICDALLGAAALGDIGKHFPDCDARYKGIDSRELLRHVAALLKDRRATAW